MPFLIYIQLVCEFTGGSTSHILNNDAPFKLVTDFVHFTYTNVVVRWNYCVMASHDCVAVLFRPYKQYSIIFCCIFHVTILLSMVYLMCL